MTNQEGVSTWTRGDISLGECVTREKESLSKPRRTPDFRHGQGKEPWGGREGPGGGVVRKAEAD